jgi:hypothetical protein
MLWKAIAELILPAGAGGDAADADLLVQRAMQSLQPSGFFPWALCDTSLGPDDANSLEFTSLALGILLRGHASQLQAATVSSAKASVPLILSALACDVAASCSSSPRGSALQDPYTNIWLTNAAAQVLLSGVAGLTSQVSSAALSQGLAELTSWTSDTQTSGIIEYDSPTYYEIDAESLETAYAFAGSAQRGTIQQALDWLWSDIADNFLPARGSLSGPHSRNYDFLTDHGSIDWHTYMLGWRASVPRASSDPMLERAILLELQQHPDAYAPSATIASAGCLSKTVTSLWGAAASGATRYNFVAAPYAIGSVSAGYGQQDQQFVAQLASDDLPVVEVVVDDTNDPYGDQKVTQGLFSKPVHLVPRPLGIQAQGDLFGLLEISPSLTSTSLATNIVFPLGAATVLLDGTQVTASTQTLTASTGSVLGVMDRGGCVAARILHVDPYGTTGGPSIRLVVDPAGLALGVGRLVAYHAPPSADGRPIACATSWTSGAPPIACQPRAAVVMKAAACSSSSDLSNLMASVRSATLTTTSASAQQWTATLSFDKSTFSAGRDRASGQILQQAVNGTAMAFGSALSVQRGAAIKPLPAPALPGFWGVGLLGSALGIVGLARTRAAARPSRTRTRRAGP